MYLGPIHPTLPTLTTGHNPVKAIRVASTTGKQVVLFDQEYPYPLQPGPVGIDAETVVYEASPAAALMRLTQILELSQNAEWQRCGMFTQWREDGIQDPEDGWYIFRSNDLSEDLLFSSYAEPKIQVELRARQRSSIGVYVDSKAVPNDANLSGVGLAALPMGFTAQYPVTTWTLPGANGNILAIENPIAVLRATLTTPITTMTQGRCRVSDQTANRSTQTEVFWKDHRNINGNWEISNDLVRYYFAEGVASPSIDVWDVNVAGWVTMGNFQLQTTNAGPVLPLQTVQFLTISPEEVIWVERRYDTAGTALVSVVNRIRRGSRLIESQIIAASGAGLTGTQSIGIVSAPNVAWTVVNSADSTGVVFTSTSKLMPGFCFLTTPPNAATAPSNTTLYSGATVPAGTITRLAILAGDSDAQLSALGSTALYAARWASYNRQRIRQRILVGLVA
ncbi:MAG TPA: hypothetical protein VGU71_22560 [Candidatus Dormibacteraeota bacterium]|nr:hypothetical protein [Candidatus Dormibacteraeota bacterium]